LRGLGCDPSFHVFFSGHEIARIWFAIHPSDRKEKIDPALGAAAS
jgi:hypothetical protein